MIEIDEQLMSEKISKSKEITVLGLRGTGYEGDILDILIDGKVYLFCIDKILQADETELKNTTESKTEFNVNLVGHCFIEHDTPEDAQRLFSSAIESTSKKFNVSMDVVNNKGRIYKIKFNGSVTIAATDFATADKMLLKAIDAVVVDKNYDCFCEVKSSTEIKFVGERK